MNTGGEGKIVFKAKDALVEVEVELENETVWLSQKKLAVLFRKDVRTISEHIRGRRVG